MSLVTLTTDFGDGSSYVAAMKGALLTVNPAARLLDLSHRLPPQDVIAAAYFLADALPWFPPGTIHVVVVDPGVGTGRALLYVRWNCQSILVPDNGCWTALLRPDDPTPHVVRLENARYWRPDVSATFHGRDILAPVAGHLTLGAAPADLGPLVTDWVRISLPRPRVSDEEICGEVVIVDPFGNLVTNIPAADVTTAALVSVAGQPVPRRVRTYGDAEPGALVALIGSSDRLEIAVVNGSAAARLGVGVGAPVNVARPERQ
jgi:S-adenosylmethionine hydrolase